MIEQDISSKLKALVRHQRVMSNLNNEQIKQVLLDVAALAEQKATDLILANKADTDRMDPGNPKYDRLLLNEARIQGIASDLRKVADLPSPLGRILDDRQLPNGLQLRKVSVPLGTIGVVYESRPNVTFDVFALCFKSGNLTVLKGSSDAHFSNIAIVKLIHQVLRDHDLPEAVYLAPSERASLKHILDAVDEIDVIIPRGGQGLINFVRQNAKVPVIETGAGIVHTYIDDSADLQQAKAIIRNAKTRRVSVCNALDTVLLHRTLLPHLPDLVSGLDQAHQLEIFADQPSFEVLKHHYDPALLKLASADHFGIEFLSMKMAIKTVESLDEALDHIEAHSSKHSEAIVAENPDRIDQFMRNVDAAVVYANTSTAFTDGAQFGLGAEIGISTQKLHARGPMALEELTSYKWLVNGNGHIRE